MGSLAVLMKIGLFEMNSGSEVRPIVELGSPIFDKITIHLDPAYYKGKTFEIEVKNNKPENYYIQSATLNGKPLKSQWLYNDQITGGGKLTIELGPEANKGFGGIVE
jgi:putative alpha-1,2-mannosidase